MAKTGHLWSSKANFKVTIYGHVKNDKEREIVKRLCKRLHEERAKQGISQQKFSELSGLSRTGIRHIESLETSPTLASLLKYSHALNLDLRELIDS